MSYHLTPPSFWGVGGIKKREHRPRCSFSLPLVASILLHVVMLHLFPTNPLIVFVFVAIILAAGSFLGILTGTGMLNAIAEDGVAVMPEAVGPYLHLIIGVLGVLFDLLLSTDAYYFALLPVVEQIASGFGTGMLTTAYAMIIGNIVGTFVSPLAPAVWLALGLSGLEMGRHIKYSLPWLWGLRIVLLIIAVFIGII